MTTTVLRGKTGALRRIATGALRRNDVSVVVANSFVAFCNESSTYWLVNEAPDSPANIAARALWHADVEAFEAAIALVDRDVQAWIVHIPDGDFSDILHPPGTSYPEDLVVKSMLKFPTGERFEAEVTEDGGVLPTVFLLDNSLSMWEPRYVLEPGLSEYTSDPPVRIERFGQETDERWLHWITTELEALIV